MNSYYQSLIHEIEQLMDESKWSLAYDLIHQELSMPYVPMDIMEILQNKEIECKSYLQVSLPRVDEDKILKWIHGTPVQQEKAVSELCTMNLRAHEYEVQEALNALIPNAFAGL